MRLEFATSLHRIVVSKQYYSLPHLILYTYVCIYIDLYMYIYIMYIYIIHICICIFVYMYNIILYTTCIHIHICTHIHISLHIYQRTTSFGVSRGLVLLTTKYELVLLTTKYKFTSALQVSVSAPQERAPMSVKFSLRVWLLNL